MRKDGRTDITKLIISFRNVAKALKNTFFFSKLMTPPLLMKVMVNGEAHISHIWELQGSYLLDDTGYHCRFFLDFTT